jgi:hypothetical protein
VVNAQSLHQSFPFFSIDWINEVITVSGTGEEDSGAGANAVEQ